MRAALRNRLVVSPLLVLVTIAVLKLWVDSKQLDSIAQRSLTSAALRDAISQHAKLCAVGIGITLAIALPLGVLLTRPGWRLLIPVALGVANVGQATPAIGVLALLVILSGIGFKVAVISLVAYCVLPILRNTIAGIEGVDPQLLDAARGQGMSRRQVLWNVELPLAVPVMLAGVRTALVFAVGVATLATFVNAGGLGDLIVAGIKTQRETVMVTGAAVTACFALTVDWLAEIAERVLTPRGITSESAL
jgi:osmoprotectant transport system permease protein